MKKLILSTLVALVGLCASAGDFTYKGICYEINMDDDQTVSVAPGIYDGKVVIPSKFNYWDTDFTVTGIADAAFYNRSGVTEVVIPGTVKYIGEQAFLGCTSLKALSIPSSVKSIGDAAFCKSGLESITIPSTVTSLGSGVLRECANLKQAIINAPITELNYRYFANCTSLQEFNIPATVTAISGLAFENCTSLKRVTVPAKVGSIDNDAFGRAPALKEIVVDSKNSNYSSIDGVLFNKEGTTLLGYPDGHGLVYTIPSGTTEIGKKAFIASRNLKKVIFPKSVNAIGWYAFQDCSALEEVCFPKDSEMIRIGYEAFYGANSLKRFVYPKGLEYIYLCVHDCKSLEEVVLPSDATAIVGYIFMDCTALKRVYCQMTEPSEIEDGVFLNVPKDQLTLYVPKGSKAKYQQAEGWRLASKIVEMDYTHQGDVDGDSHVNVSDVTALINSVLGSANHCPTSCDVDGNGQINVSDVTSLINVVLGK